MVIGAGVVGLACARALALAGREVIVLEAGDRIGSGISSRNSEVIHAGIYYPPGSLKARLCVEGKQRLYAYCRERHIGHRNCGKLIVAAQAEEIPRLEAMQARAAANGVPDLQLLEADAAQALEPALACAAALLSPSSGIVDSHALMLSLLGDLENAGGMLALKADVDCLEIVAHGIIVRTREGTSLQARQVVNAAGLQAPALAAATRGLDARHVPRAYYAKGHYFSLTAHGGRSPFSRLIYPLPNEAGLGVHLTLDLAGQARFGPDVEWIEPPVDGHFDYTVDPGRISAFEAEIRRYWPALPEQALAPAYSGIRPKLSGPGEPAADFRIDSEHTHGIPGLVNLFGIESPGLTSCLAIGQDVVARLEI